MKYEMKSFRYLASIIIALAFAAPARATEFAAGDGSPACPYEIGSAAQLAKFRDIVNGANGETKNSAACARLAADIDLAGADWTPIGLSLFTGTFDGQGHTIGGLSVDLQDSGNYVCAGLFGSLGENGTVKDLGVRGDVAARGSGDNTTCYAGGIAGFNFEGTVEGCFHVGSVSADSTKFSFAGGVVGSNNGTVRNCRHAGPVSSTASNYAYGGGVVGNNAPESAARNCYAVGTVTATGDGLEFVGGVAGENSGTLKNCYYDKTVAGAIGAVNGGDTADATGKKTAEMQGADALSRLALNAGLDADAWTATAGYPELKAFAYPLWIGGVQFTAGNLVIDADDDPGIASGTATYDPASNTLWLTNFVYSVPGLLTNFIHRALYYEAHSPDFVIDVSGTNRLALVGADGGGYSFGLDFRRGNGHDQTTVTIRSEDGGRLSVAADAASYSYGIYAAGADLVIDGAAVSAVGGPGLYYSFGAYLDLCRLTIKSGSLAAKGGKATFYNSAGVFFSSTDESLFVKGGSLIATGGEGARASYGIERSPGSVTPFSFTGGETLAQGGTAGIADASLSVADGLAVFAGADADGAAPVEGDGWKNQKCVRIAAPLKTIAATVTFNNGNGAVVYDGQGHGVEVAVTDPAEGAAVLFALGDSSGPTNTFSVTAPMFTNACDATVWVEISAEGYTTVTNSARVKILPPPSSVSNVVARQRWPWNGLVDVDYDIAGEPDDLAGLRVEISFEEQGGRHWAATNFLAGAEPTLNPGHNRATWDAKAAGATNIAAELTATVKLVKSFQIDLDGIPVFSGVSNCQATRDNSNVYLSGNAAVYAFLSNSFSTAEHSAANEIVFPNVSCFFFSHANGEDDGIDLSDEGRAVIKTFATFLSVTDMSEGVLVEGYTCDLGSVGDRDECSQRRAENVKAELAKYIPASKVTAKWYGKRMFKKFKYDTKAEYDRVNIRIQ